MSKKMCLLALVLSLLVVSCGKDNDHGNGGGFGGEGAIQATVDITGAVGLAVTDPGQSSGSTVRSIIARQNANARLVGAPLLTMNDVDPKRIARFVELHDGDSTVDGTKSLSKVDEDGNVSPVITTSSSTTGTQNLPSVSTIAISPANEVFIQFAQPFRVTEPTTSTPPNGNPWSDGTYCQIFRVAGGTVAQLKAAPPSAANLECLDHDHFVMNYNGTRGSAFQFDSTGNVYYTGQLPGPGSRTSVVYKWDRATGALTEKINANICVQDFLVTPSGGVFYTGTSSCENGGGGHSGGYFRYLSPGALLTQIVQGWWNFIYHPVSTSTTDKAVFYGPDPTVANTASWDSACLFTFDPSANPKTSSLITCGNNVWNWVEMRRGTDIATYGGGYNCLSNPSSNNCKDFSNNQAQDIALLSSYTTEFNRRCTSTQSFAGSGSQISAIKQTSAGDTYVVGAIQIKTAGTLNCGIQIRGPHCKLNGIPDSNYTSSSTCTNVGGIWLENSGWCSNPTYNASSVNCLANGGTWNRNSDWYNNVATQGSETTSYCTVGGAGQITNANWWSGDNAVSKQSVSGAGNNTTVFTINHLSCQAPNSLSGSGNGWTREYRGMAKVDTGTQSLTLISSTNEQALNLWLVNDKVYYSSFNVSTGQYYLNYYDGSTVHQMATGLEAYHLAESGDTGTLYFDGLNFSDNSYRFGTILSAPPYTQTARTGLTGLLKTFVYTGRAQSQWQ